MKLNPLKIQFTIDIISTQITQRYAHKKGLTYTEALQFLMGTNTYQLLNDPESYLYLESVEYVLDMLDAEEINNTERWLTV